ncbi:MAG: hypothetical protein AABY16_03710 [Nanoarchaeota archaeon]
MTLFMFYGTECVHCHEMVPLVERLEKEEKVKVTRMETWHNSKNAKKLQETDKGRCGGVPFFYNDVSKKFICGSTSYENLKKWALGK